MIGTVWQQRMIVAWNLGDPVRLAQLAIRHGYKTVAVKVNDGHEPYAGAHDLNLEPAAHSVLRRAGLVVGGWGYLYGQYPHDEVTTIAHELARLRLGFYIADAEAEFEHGAGGGEYARSARFTDAYRSILPIFPSAVTSFGRVSLHAVDWAAWQLAGFRFLPQCYWNENSALRPSLCVVDAASVGVSLRRFRRHGAVSWADARFVHPMLGCYQGARGRVPAREYRADLALARTRGFSIYADDFALELDYAGLGGR